MIARQYNRNDKWTYAVVALCLLHPCFYLLFNSNLLFLPLIITAFGSLFSFLNRRNYRLDGVGFLWMWLLCGLFFSDVAEAVDYRSGLTSHYSFNGTYIAIGLITSVSLCIFCKSGKRREVWCIASALMAIALVLTTKRAHLLSAIAAIVLTYCLTRKSGKFTRLLFALGLVAIFLQIGSSFVPGISESITRLFDTIGNASSDGNLLTRGVLWRHAWSVFLDHPLFGQGWGTFIYHWANGETTLIAHNELMNTLAEGGALGAALINGLVLFSMISTLRLLKQNEESSLQGYLLSSICLQIYSVIYGYSTGTLFSYEINFVPYLMSIAILCACRYRIKAIQGER